jgi:hypothetical protein
MHMALPPYSATASALGKDAAVNSYREIAAGAGLKEGVCLKFRDRRSLLVLNSSWTSVCSNVDACLSRVADRSPRIVQAIELSESFLLSVICFIGSTAERRQAGTESEKAFRTSDWATL